MLQHELSVRVLQCLRLLASGTCQTWCSSMVTMKENLLMVVNLLRLVMISLFESHHTLHQPFTTVSYRCTNHAKQSIQKCTATGILARSSCGKLQSALVIDCILEVQPAGLGAVQRLLACHCMRCRTLCACSTCMAAADLQLQMQVLRDNAARCYELPECSPQISSPIFEDICPGTC